MTWQSTQKLLRGVFAAAVVALIALKVTVSAQTEEDPEPPREPGALKVELEAQVEDREATFTWRFEDLEDGEDVVCTLDPEGDAIFEYSVPDCEQNRELDHRYEAAGTYVARLMARTRDGRAGRAMIRVEVR